MGKNVWRQPPSRGLRRPDRYRQCLRKASSFGSPSAAEIEARAARRRYGRPIQVYECEYCGRWHIGTARRLQRWIEDGQRNRSDVVLVAVLGERACVCGQLESTGPVGARLAAIKQRALAARRRSRAVG